MTEDIKGQMTKLRFVIWPLVCYNSVLSYLILNFISVIGLPITTTTALGTKGGGETEKKPNELFGLGMFLFYFILNIRLTITSTYSMLCDDAQAPPPPPSHLLPC